MSKIPVVSMTAKILRCHLEHGAQLVSYWKPRRYSVQKAERWFVLFVDNADPCRVQKSTVDALLKTRVITPIQRGLGGCDYRLTEIVMRVGK